MKPMKCKLAYSKTSSLEVVAAMAVATIVVAAIAAAVMAAVAMVVVAAAMVAVVAVDLVMGPPTFECRFLQHHNLASVVLMLALISALDLSTCPIVEIMGSLQELEQPIILVPVSIALSRSFSLTLPVLRMNRSLKPLTLSLVAQSVFMDGGKLLIIS